MNTQPQRIKVDDATRTNDNKGISWCPNSWQGKLLNLVSLTNLFEILYPRLKSIPCYWEIWFACLSKIYLDSSNLSDDDNFNLPNYNAVRADYPSNTKKGIASVNFKNSLPLKVIDIQLLQEYINIEIKIADKTCNFTSLYRSPSQSKRWFWILSR